MYHDYFGLKEPAFSIAVNPKYLYMSSQHKEALAHLIYGVQGGGFVLLSGEVGTGKTTIVRCLLEQMPGDTEIAFVLNPMADVHGLLATICEELRVAELPSDAQIKDMMGALQGKLLQNHAEGKRTVLLIDEAQLLSADVLEQIRLLTNLETSTDKLLQIVLVGQPEVNDLLAQPRLRQLSQRITARFHLEALSLAETKQYIEHRLSIAGKKEGRIIFPDNIIKKIHQFSGGIPRLINILSERLLVGAYGHNKYEIDNTTFKKALAEVEGLKPIQNKQAAPSFRWDLALVGLSITCLSLITLILFSPWQNNENVNAQNAPSELPTQLRDQALSDGVLPEDNLQNTDHDIESNVIESIRNKEATQHDLHFLSNADAYSQLFRYHNIRLNEQSHPCWQTERHGYGCTKLRVDTWEAFYDFNRPAILSLVTEEKELKYAVVVGSESPDFVLILTKTGETVAVKKQRVAKAWNGNFVYIWKKPSGYNKPLSVGANATAVTWAANQFALLDGQSEPITKHAFSTRLQTRIKIFQANNGLTQDGILGERTIMKLNEKIGQATPLINR